MSHTSRRVAGRAGRAAKAALFAAAAVVLALLANGLAVAAVHRHQHVLIAIAAAIFGAVACAFWWTALELRGLPALRRAGSVVLLAAALLPYAAWLGAPAVLIGILLAVAALRGASRKPWGALVGSRRRR